MRLNRTTISALGALAILLSACGDSNLIGPENQLEATNATDQFQFQLTALVNVTDSRTYTWVNTGAQATIDVSQAITGGTAVITIRDADGTVMYSADAAEDNDATTQPGRAGDWQIEVRLTETNGTFNFRVQKAT